MIARLDGDHIVLPGLASAHSHAFQRALRARTQRAASSRGSFWSWRGLMYELAARVTPDDVFDLSRFAFVELARCGVTAVGEFHYLHHDPSGAPYADRLELADAVIRAAREAGLRITLLRVIYQRAGTGRAPEGAQRRFSDARLDDALADVEALVSRHAADPLVRVGIAPH
nr:amidohydrolase family protein [Myxococcota bacterium]